MKRARGRRAGQQEARQPCAHARKWPTVLPAAISARGLVGDCDLDARPELPWFHMVSYSTYDTRHSTLSDTHAHATLRAPRRPRRVPRSRPLGLAGVATLYTYTLAPRATLTTLRTQRRCCTAPPPAANILQATYTRKRHPGVAVQPGSGTKPHAHHSRLCVSRQVHKEG